MLSWRNNFLRILPSSCRFGIGGSSAPVCCCKDSRGLQWLAMTSSISLLVRFIMLIVVIVLHAQFVRDFFMPQWIALFPWVPFLSVVLLTTFLSFLNFHYPIDLFHHLVFFLFKYTCIANWAWWIRRLQVKPWNVSGWRSAGRLRRSDCQMQWFAFGRQSRRPGVAFRD
jgi:hypothetical protein